MNYAWNVNRMCTICATYAWKNIVGCIAQVNQRVSLRLITGAECVDCGMWIDHILLNMQGFVWMMHGICTDNALTLYELTHGMWIEYVPFVPNMHEKTLIMHGIRVNMFAKCMDVVWIMQGLCKLMHGFFMNRAWITHGLTGYRSGAAAPLRWSCVSLKLITGIAQVNHRGKMRGLWNVDWI